MKCQQSDLQNFLGEGQHYNMKAKVTLGLLYAHYNVLTMLIVMLYRRFTIIDEHDY